mmetsp:Transcript_139589/g.353956  ORF Transcript_139589/g.353956 Transcript_139589/m.353956 type:complete len:335 (+) Transcript_139589:176-1180(+)
MTAALADLQDDGSKCWEGLHCQLDALTSIVQELSERCSSPRISLRDLSAGGVWLADDCTGPGSEGGEGGGNSSGRAVRLEDFDHCRLLVHRRHGQRRLPLGVGLLHARPDLQQVLDELLPPIARRVVQAAVAGGVHRERVGTAVQEQLHDGDPVGTDGVAQGSNAFVVLLVERLLPLQILLDRLELAILGGLVQSQGSVVDPSKGRLELLWNATHLLAELHHQLLVLQMLHGSLQSVLLDILQDGRKLRVVLQGLDALLHRGVAIGEFRVVVLGDGLGLQPAAHGVRVLREFLHALGSVRIALDILFHLRPSRVVDVGEPGDLHGGAIADVQCL